MRSRAKPGSQSSPGRVLQIGSAGGAIRHHGWSWLAPPCPTCRLGRSWRTGTYGMPGRSPWRRSSGNRISTGGSAVEYKINPGKLDPGPAEAFRSLYPDGSSYVVTLRVREPYRIRRRGIAFTMCAPHHMQAVRQAGHAVHLHRTPVENSAVHDGSESARSPLRLPGMPARI